MVTLDVAAARSDASSASRDISAAKKMTIRFISALSAFSAIEHVDGAYPPKVGATTHYNAIFSVQGGGNESREAKLSAVVPRGVEIGALPPSVTFTTNTRTLIWTIGTIAPNEPKTVNVPLSHTPTVLEVGNSPTLIQAQTIESVDAFTQQKVTVSLNVLTTTTSDSQGGGMVQQ